MKIDKPSVRGSCTNTSDADIVSAALNMSESIALIVTWRHESNS